MVSVGAVCLALVAVAAAGAVAGALLLPERLPDSVATTATASTVKVSGQVYDGAHQVAATPQVATAQVLRTARAGVLTASSCEPGGVVASGGGAWAVDGQPLVGLATAVPLWRDLAVGAKGADVSGLQVELARLGYAVTVDGTYGASTRTALVKLFSLVGASFPSNGTLPLGWVVWLPSPEVAVASCPVRVGDPVGFGDTLAQAAGGLTALVLANPPGEGWVVGYQGRTAAADANGVVADAEFLAAVEAGPEYRFYTSMGTGSIPLVVSLTTPRDVLVVPPSSVVVAAPGSGCLVSGGQAVPVDIVASSLGQTMVAVTGGTPPTEVVLHPDSSVRCS